MVNLRPAIRIGITSFTLLAVAVALMVTASDRTAAAQQSDTTTCAPTATDSVDISSIEVLGREVSWTAHANACAYRVFLKARPSAERLDTVESTTGTSYTVPSASVVTGAKYQLTIRLLDSAGKPAGVTAQYWFYFHPTLSQCAVSTDSSASAIATPTPNPTSTSSACNLLPLQKNIGLQEVTAQNAARVLLPARPYTAGEYRRAIQNLKCTSSGSCPADAEGITAIDGSIMAQLPRKATESRNFWVGYNFFNKMAVSNPSEANVDCSLANRDGDLDGDDDTDEADDILPIVSYTGPESISVGFVTGEFAGKIYKNELVVVARYHDQELDGEDNKLRCVVKRTHIQNGQHAGIHTQIGHVSGGWWRVRAWFGQWVEIARFHTSWEEAPSAAHGQEIWAKNLQFNQVHAPLNQISRVSLTIDGQRLPWYETALPTAFRGRSETLTPGPFGVSDNRGFNHTSITTCVIKPGTNFCYPADRSLGRITAASIPTPTPISASERNDLIFDMIADIEASVIANPTYMAADLELSGCLSGTSTTKSDETDGASGERIATLPFGTVIENYGTYKTRMESGGDCHQEASDMFDANETASKVELAKLRNARPRPAWADLLDNTTSGADFAESVGNADEIWRYVALIDSARSSSESSSTRTPIVTPLTGANCILPGDKAMTDGAKIAALNCLVFDTPYSFWLAQSEFDIDSNALALASKVDGRYDWLGYEHWDCTSSPDGPLPACLRHDVAWATLRKIIGGDEGDDTIDAAWNPRNKYAADEQFFFDIAAHGCPNPSLIAEASLCNKSSLELAYLMLWAVRDHNDKNWPYTKQDIQHVENNRRFVECSVPIPRVANVGITNQTEGVHVASWQLERSCVSDISIESYDLKWRISVTWLGISYVAKPNPSTKANGQALSSTISQSHYPWTAKGTLESVKLLSIEIKPRELNMVFGGDTYPAQLFTDVSWQRGD